LKACPSTLTSLLTGVGKEHQDTVESESLLENQIHRLEKFSEPLPGSWWAKCREAARASRRAEPRAGCGTLTTVVHEHAVWLAASEQTHRTVGSNRVRLTIYCIAVVCIQ